MKFKLTNYNCELGEILGFTDNAGERWLSAKKIGSWLKLTNIRTVLPNVDEKNKRFVKKSEISDIKNLYVRIANRGEWFLNYRGFIKICFNSRTPKAKQVQDVVGDIFESVAETGSFSIKQNNQLSTLDILKIATDEIKRLEFENKQQALQIENQEQELEEKEQVIEDQSNVIEENNRKFYTPGTIKKGTDVWEIAGMLINRKTNKKISRTKLYDLLVEIGIFKRVQRKKGRNFTTQYVLSTNKALDPVLMNNIIPRIDIVNGYTFTVQTFLPPAFDRLLEILEDRYDLILNAGMRGNTSPRYDY